MKHLKQIGANSNWRSHNQSVKFLALFVVEFKQ